MTDNTKASAINRDALPPMIKTERAAAMLDTSTRMIRKMCGSGEIKAAKVGDSWRINTAAFLAQFGL